MPKRYRKIRCNAITGTDEPCKRFAAPGSTRCHFHGAQALKGVEAPSFKTGLRSKQIPKDLDRYYEEALQDTQLLSLRKDIALVDAKLTHEKATLDRGGASVDQWEEIFEIVVEMSTAARAGDTQKLNEGFVRLQDKVREIHQRSDRWKDIEHLMILKQKLSDSEKKHLIQAQQIITVERLVVVVTALSAIINEELTEANVAPEIYDRIARRFRRLLGLDVSRQDRAVEAEVVVG